MATETVNINTTLADNSVTNAKLANVATNTLKGRVAAGTGDPQDLTADQASTVLDSATDPFVRTSNLPAGIQDGDTLAIGLTFPDGGLKVAEEGAGVNTLAIRVDEVFGADRVLNIQMSDADRILHLTGDAELQGTNTGDQTLNGLLPTQTGNNGKFLKTDGTNASWDSAGGGSGDVVGPASSTNNNVPQWDGTTGELLKDGLGVSLGGNVAADSTKLSQFNTEGQIHGSVENSSTAAVRGTSSGTGYAGYFSGAKGSMTLNGGDAMVEIGSADFPLNVVQSGAGDIAHFEVLSGQGLEVKNDGGLRWTSATGAATSRTGLGLGTLATQSGTFSGTSSGTNTGDQDLSPYQTIAALAADVRAVVLTGISFATSTAITAADSILVALGKLQAFNNLFTTVGLAIGRLTNPGAVTWVRMNADNTATARTASETRTDLGLGTAAVVNTGTGASDVPTITQADARYLLASNEIIGVLGSTQTTSSTSLTDCTGLSVAVAANSTYQIEGFILFQSNNINNGISVSLNGPSSPTHVAFNTAIARNLTTNGVSNAKAYDEGNVTVDVGAANTTYFALMNGALVNGANAGTLQFRFASENSGNSVSIIVGSSLRLRKIA